MILDIIFISFQFTCYKNNQTLHLMQHNSGIRFSAWPTQGDPLCQEMNGKLFLLKFQLNTQQYIYDGSLEFNYDIPLTVDIPCPQSANKCPNAFTTTFAQFTFSFPQNGFTMVDTISEFYIVRFDRNDCTMKSSLLYDIQNKNFQVRIQFNDQCLIQIDQTQSVTMVMQGFPDFVIQQDILLNGITKLSDINHDSTLNLSRFLFDCAVLDSSSNLNCSALLQQLTQIKKSIQMSFSFPSKIPDLTGGIRIQPCTIQMQITDIQAIELQDHNCFTDILLQFYKHYYILYWEHSTDIYCIDLFKRNKNIKLIIQLQTTSNFQLGENFVYQSEIDFIDPQLYYKWISCEDKKCMNFLETYNKDINYYQHCQMELIFDNNQLIYQMSPKLDRHSTSTEINAIIQKSEICLNMTIDTLEKTQEQFQLQIDGSLYNYIQEIVPKKQLYCWTTTKEIQKKFINGKLLILTVYEEDYPIIKVSDYSLLDNDSKPATIIFIISVIIAITWFAILLKRGV